LRFHSHEALILEVRDLQDADRIVAFLTRERGHKRGVARGARRRHSRFAGQLQPLARVRVHWGEKEGRDLVRISGAELLRPAHGLGGDLEGLLLGSYLADHMLAFAQEDEPSELYFRLLDSTLEALAAGVDRDLAARYFEVWVLRLAGVFPPPRECPQCGAPYPPAGAVLPASGEALLCPGCAGAAAGGLAVPAPVLGFLVAIGRASLPELAAAGGADAAVLRRAEELAARVRRAFLGHELRSYEVMRRTLAEVGD
jgi:DNA repair protein RecO (recombination protein O)